MAYVIGVADGAEIVGYNLLKKTKAGSQLYCPRADVENDQKYSIVVKYLKDHPEKMDTETGYLVVDALIVAFPCPADNHSNGKELHP